MSWVLGMLILLAGGTFRLSAFRTLGRHFTFDLAVLKDHKLITSGPYAIVRHPSYTGLVGMMWGTTITIGSRGSWTREILWETLMQGSTISHATPSWLPWAQTFGALMIIGQAVVLTGIATRTRTEDEMLRKEFGKQWTDWARVTKWKLFPGIY
jgi:protein-S-isoprenylcysteine O-methyltransferase Ste14